MSPAAGRDTIVPKRHQRTETPARCPAEGWMDGSLGLLQGEEKHFWLPSKTED